MSKIYCVFVGWEERCLLSVQDSLNSSFNECIILYSTDFIERTKKSVQEIIKHCEAHSIPYKEEEIPVYSPAESWNSSYKVLSKVKDAEVLINISTMPRSVMWNAFSLFEHNNCNLEFLYARPVDYGEGITGGPLSPWIQPKQSGIPDLDKKVALLVSVGFDTDRTEQLIKYFSPEIVVMFGQEGTQYKNHKRCVSNHLDRIVNKCGSSSCSVGESCDDYDCEVEFVKVDSFADDYGLSTMREYAHKLSENYNIVMSSLGPKPSAISIYQLYRGNPEFALVYAPYKEISKSYSTGIKEIVMGKI